MTDNLLSLFALIVESAVKGTIVIALIAIASIVMRRATASTRHSIFGFSLIAMIAIPLFTVVVPRFDVRVFGYPVNNTVNEYQQSDSPAQMRSTRDPQPVLESTPRLPNALQTVTDAPQPVVTKSRIGLWESAAFLWLGGVVAGLITIFGGLLTLRRVSRDARSITGTDWDSIVNSLKRELGITREVRVAISRNAAMPATWGTVNPVVILPATAEDWDSERRRIVLMHELAHVKRNDCFVQIVAQVACAVYWFHPGVWYSARRMRAERELACDEHVLGAGVNACDYASHLLEIATTFRSPAGSAIVGVAMARPSQLEGRLCAILTGDLDNRWRASKTLRIAAVVALGVLTVPLAAMRPANESNTKSQSLASSEIHGSLSFADVPPAAGFHWNGTVAAGSWIEIHSTNGNITIKRSTDERVDVSALKAIGGDDNAKIAMEKTRKGRSFCAVSMSASESQCETGVTGELKYGAENARVDFIVKVPAGVGIAAHTRRGKVVAKEVQSYVWATTDEGDIDISTTDLAEASSRAGSINATFGRRTWTQNLEFLTEQGDVTVHAPADARMVIEASTGNGSLESQFPGDIQRDGKGRRMFTRIGSGKGALTLRSEKGAIELKRGPNASGEKSDIAVQSEGVDPKPNPNPDPGFNPDPNPNPHVDGDATDERVSVSIPSNLMEQFSNARIAGYPDARAIARLRDIGLMHVKQHSADLVRERSEWALTLVRNGKLVDPLISALSNSDWRIRAYAAWALGETRDPRATEPLAKALGDEHWRVRMHAASGLQVLGTTQQIGNLIGVLHDTHWQVRISAVDALARIGDARAKWALQQVAESDERQMVRDEARSAIDRIR